MHNGSRNIPTDIIRTVVAVAETGSLTRAARKLGISQPAVTSQIKRIEEIVGGALFAKSSSGSVVTDFGRLFLEQARRMLDANDHILQLSGMASRPQPARLGISSMFMHDFIDSDLTRSMTNISVQIEGCIGIAKSLVESHIDVACLLDNPQFTTDVLDLVIGECVEEFAWVRAPHFVLPPGKPIPILVWSRDEFMMTALTRHGLAYNIVLNTKEYNAKLFAAATGMGITAMPRRLIPPNLVAADDDYLPKLPPIRGLLCARPNLPPLAQGIADSIALRYFRSNRADVDANRRTPELAARN